MDAKLSTLDDADTDDDEADEDDEADADEEEVEDEEEEDGEADEEVLGETAASATPPASLAPTIVSATASSFPFFMLGRTPIDFRVPFCRFLLRRSLTVFISACTIASLSIAADASPLYNFFTTELHTLNACHAHRMKIYIRHMW